MTANARAGPGRASARRTRRGGLGYAPSSRPVPWPCSRQDADQSADAGKAPDALERSGSARVRAFPWVPLSCYHPPCPHAFLSLRPFPSPVCGGPSRGIAGRIRRSMVHGLQRAAARPRALDLDPTPPRTGIHDTRVRRPSGNMSAKETRSSDMQESIQSLVSSGPPSGVPRRPGGLNARNEVNAYVHQRLRRRLQTRRAAPVRLHAVPWPSPFQPLGLRAPGSSWCKARQPAAGCQLDAWSLQSGVWR